MLLAAVALAVSLLLLVETKPAEAAFPGKNGKIAFVSERTTGAGVDNPTGDLEVFTINLNGTGLTQLTFNTASDSTPNWSPDGTRIAFLSNRDNNFEIYTMEADGDNQINRSNNTAHDSQPAFSPEGAQIVFRSDRDGNAEVYTMKDDGDSPTNRTSNPAFDALPDWQPILIGPSGSR